MLLLQGFVKSNIYIYGIFCILVFIVLILMEKKWKREVLVFHPGIPVVQQRKGRKMLSNDGLRDLRLNQHRLPICR